MRARSRLDGTGKCPQSVGLGQVRYSPGTARSRRRRSTSTANNLDVAYAIWRDCFEGQETWLNNVERGQQYVAGDAWGCVGRWFSGRWYTAAANKYIGSVQGILAARTWATAGF